ncbi:hypothetical protein VTK56DRAFT_5695 [Thermocarpiscus australiensis]
MSSDFPSVRPTCYGFLATTMDALLVVEGCLRGYLNHVPRRPYPAERDELMRSGNIFVYEENASGVKRWTDGIKWSPSRVHRDYLVYREVLEKGPPQANGSPKDKEDADSGKTRSASRKSRPRPDPARAQMMEELRPYVGALLDSYEFKPESLIKKSLTVNYGNEVHHVVSYYTLGDVTSGRLKRVRTYDPRLSTIVPRAELFKDQRFPEVVFDDCNAGATEDWRVWYRSNRLEEKFTVPLPLPSPGGEPQDMASETPGPSSQDPSMNFLVEDDGSRLQQMPPLNPTFHPQLLLLESWQWPQLLHSQTPQPGEEMQSPQSKQLLYPQQPEQQRQQQQQSIYPQPPEQQSIYPQPPEQQFIKPETPVAKNEGNELSIEELDTYFNQADEQPVDRLDRLFDFEPWT